MKVINMIAIAAIVTTASFSVLAGETDKALTDPQAVTAATEHHTGKQGGIPMMDGKQGGMPMMEMMQKKQDAMQEHMQKMETHMVNIEAMLKELVQLQKSK